MATTERPHASIVILNYNGERYLGPCLESVFASDAPSFEVIVVDNASTDRSLDLLAPHGDRIRLIRNPRNLLSTRGLNPGIRAARAPIVVLLDTDTEVRRDWLRELIGPIQIDPTVAVTGSKLLYPDGVHLQHGGGFLHFNAIAGHYGHDEKAGHQWDQEREVGFVTGAATAIRRSFLDEVGGGLDEVFPFYYEDCDICYQAWRLGYRVLYVPSAGAIHHESVGMGRGSFRYLYNLHRGRSRFLLKNLPVKQLCGRAIATEAMWVWIHARRLDQLLPVCLGHASALPALPRVIRSRMAIRRAVRDPAHGPVSACVMASSLFVRANGDLSCWSDHGKDLRLTTLSEPELRSSGCDAINVPALRAIRRAFMEGRLPRPKTCDHCAMSRQTVVTERSEECRFVDLLHVEPSHRCRLRCPGCPPKRGRRPHLMPLSFWGALLANLQRQGVARVRTVEFNGIGEPLVNPELPQMVALAEHIFPGSECVLTTNGNFGFTDDLGRAPVDTLRVKVDGVDQRSYARYRRGGSLSKALAFLGAAASSRDRRGTPRRVEWRYILFQWNDSDEEIRTATRMARDLGVHCHFELSFGRRASRRFTSDNLDEALSGLAPDAANLSRLDYDGSSPTIGPHAIT